MAVPKFSYLKDISRDQLVDILESVPEKKDLVIDAQLMKPLDHIAGATFLKKHGVEKIFKLGGERLDAAACNRRIYLLRPELHGTKFVADHINHDKGNGKTREYKIVFVPRKLCVCDSILELEGVYGDAKLSEYRLEFIPLDDDVLSLEMHHFFKDYFLDRDQSWLCSVAQSLVTLQQLYGTIPAVYSVGNCAKMVSDILKELIDEAGEYRPLDGPEIGSLILLDRDVDYVTPLCSQVTYMGLIDDTFGTKSGFVEFGKEVTQKDQTVKLLLNSQDTVFSEIRDRHFSNVFGFLSQTAKEVQSGYDKRHNLSSVSDMKQFVSDELRDLRQQHKSLAIHIGACEVVLKRKSQEDFERRLRTEHSLLEGIESKEDLDYIEECTARQISSLQTLQLLCLLSLTRGGVDPRIYKSLKHQYLQSFGHEHLGRFSRLKQLGLFTETDRKNTFKTLTKKLNLVPKGSVDLRNPSHMSYVLSGAFSPFSCKIVEMIASQGISPALEEVCRLLNTELDSSRRGVSAKSRPTGAAQPSKPCTLVMFLGGCTYTEISALRFLGRATGTRFIVATTAIVNGARLLQSALE